MSGTKYDSGKPRFTLIPPTALREVAEVVTFGANKYGDENWRKLDNLESRYVNAALRHINEYLTGHETDPESGRHVLAHAVISLLFVLDHTLSDQKESSS